MVAGSHDRGGAVRHVGQAVDGAAQQVVAANLLSGSKVKLFQFLGFVPHQDLLTVGGDGQAADASGGAGQRPHLHRGPIVDHQFAAGPAQHHVASVRREGAGGGDQRRHRDPMYLLARVEIQDLEGVVAEDERLAIVGHRADMDQRAIRRGKLLNRFAVAEVPNAGTSLPADHGPPIASTKLYAAEGLIGDAAIDFLGGPQVPQPQFAPPRLVFAHDQSRVPLRRNGHAVRHRSQHAALDFPQLADVPHQDFARSVGRYQQQPVGRDRHAGEGMPVTPQGTDRFDRRDGYRGGGLHPTGQHGLVIEDRALQLVLAETGPEQVGAPEVGLVQPSSPEVGIFQIRLAEICSREVGLGEVGIFQVGLAAADRFQDGAGQLSVLEVGVGQVGFAELAAVEPRGAGVAA